MDELGNSPFWDGLAGRFFDMSFPEADQFNAMHGTRFIADLMPRTPIYVSLLDDAAKSVIGHPHPSGLGALRMLEEEGFVFDRYIDIFDGGPTVLASTDRIKTVQDSTTETVAEVAEGGKQQMILATGTLHDFVACRASVTSPPGGGLVIDPEAAALLDVTAGDQLLAVAR